MTRVALFFDGKNHISGFTRSFADRWIDHAALAHWVAERVGGTFHIAHYYTGVPTNREDAPGRRALESLLDNLEVLPGFFVHRLPRRMVDRACLSCGADESYSEEKAVDTSIVADMILLAVRDAYDVAVLFSGDQDLTPALDAVHGLGKRAWVATFGTQHAAGNLLRAAWASIDLSEHAEGFTHGSLEEATGALWPDEDEVDAAVLRELRRAETHFRTTGGFVGAHYFVNRWRGHGIPDAPEDRRQACRRLMAAGRIETYESDGKEALRSVVEE